MSVDSCLVHGSENASKFQATLTKFRRLQEFSELIYRQVPRQCCSCCGPSNCSSINIDSLRKLCLGLISTATLKNDSDQQNEDLEPRHLKKNKKKQAMKFDLRSELKQQLDDYEAGPDDYDDYHDYYCYSNYKPKYFRTRVQRFYVEVKKARKIEVKSSETLDQIVASFKPIPVPDGCCMVHDRKYKSKFNNLFNRLRNSCYRSNRVYQEFPKSCCSCHRERSINSIDPNLFIEELQRIQSSLAEKERKPENPFYWIVLRYKTDLDETQRRFKSGQFIGKNGKNLRNWEVLWHIYINIIDASSTEKIKERLKTIGEINPEEGIIVSFKKRNLRTKYIIQVDQIREKILAAWEATTETNRYQRQPILPSERSRQDSIDDEESNVDL